MTRGSTGNSKVLPVTQTHLKQIYSCGTGGLINYAAQKKNYKVFLGVILNLNFPSNIHTMDIDGKQITYGYSSGTYARLNPIFDTVSLLPRQEEIDALGNGMLRKDWQKRFELAYPKAQNQNAAALGVTPVILSFARYVKHKYGKNLLTYGKPRRYSAPAYPKSTSSTDLSSKGTSKTCPS